MKKAVFASILGLLLLGGADARTWNEVRASGTIRIATEGAFPPFNMMEGRNLTGFEVDLANALAASLNLKVEWVTQPFDNLLIGLQQGRYDMVIASHGVTPERANAVTFTNPHYCTGGAVFSRPGGPRTAAELRGKTVAVQVGTTYLGAVENLPGVTVRTFPRDTDAQAALLAGRVDAWVGDKFTGLELMRAQQGRLQAGSLLFNERVAMAVQKGNTSLANILSAALARSYQNGTYARISNQYFGQDVRCR